MATFVHTGNPSVPDTEITFVTSDADSTIVLSLLAANLTANSTDITVSHKDSSSVLKNELSYQITIPAKSSLEVLANKYILPSGETLRIQSAISGSVSLAASYVIV